VRRWPWMEARPPKGVAALFRRRVCDDVSERNRPNVRQQRRGPRTVLHRSAPFTTRS
jgi:hypothetical protein